MNIKRLNWLWALGLLIMASCSEKKGEDGEVSNADAEHAIEITLPLYATEKNNTGYGNVQEIASEDAANTKSFTREHNTEWYYFRATEDGRLGFTLEPNDSTVDYNFLLFRAKDSTFVEELSAKTAVAERSNLASNTETNAATGLGCTATEDYTGMDGDNVFSAPVNVIKDELFYLVVDHEKATGTGYTIRFSYCGPGEGVAITSDATETTSEAIAANLPPTPTLPQVQAPVAKPAPRRPIRHSNNGALGPDEEYYYVKKNNTLYSISTTHGMAVYDVMKRNRMVRNNITIGQRLIVKKYRAGAIQDVGSEVARNEDQTSERPAAAPAAPEQPVSMAPAEQPATQPVVETPVETPTVVTQPVATEPAAAGEKVESIAARNAKPVSSGAPAVANSVEAKNAISETVQKMYVYVNVVNSKNNNPINTIVQVVDAKNNKRIDRIPSNQLAFVPLYNDGGRKKIFVLDAFSFRKESFELDLDNIMNDSSANQIAVVNDTIVLNFELERYRKKDIFAAYNIFFYDDASVMLPKSKYELESLLEMMKENPRTRIRIHGHTNSNTIGKIIALEPGDNDFFRLTAKNKELFGTAVQLSKRRAESIKYYLQFHGVKDPRVELRGWGGKKMIYERDVPMAHKNKRVEIEILDE
jgi:outer membrane protein OmpA-like peptidoglycan-associated protein